MATVQVPEAFKFLYEPMRHKAAHGGRGSAKSHSFAQAAVIQARIRPLTVLCTREIQNSIKDSVKKLLDQKIYESGLGDYYSSTDQEIKGRDGGGFIFKGLRTNPDSVKSTESVDIAWVEEANRVSVTSLELLIPTVRNPGSELWFTWNPDSPKDPVDAMFRGPDGPPPMSIVREVNYDDNPFFPEVLRAEMEYTRRRDPDKYAHVWRGKYRRNSEARVFKNWRVEEFEAPRDARFYFGADWGFSIDPSVLIRCFIEGRTMYVDHEAYKVGCEIDDLPKLFAGRDGASEDEKKAWGPGHELLWPGVPGAKKWRIIADSARPETISYMKRKGFNIMPAKKGAGSVEDGIEFLQSYDIVVHPRCVNTIDELSFYSWKIDKQTQEVLPVLEDKDNHVIDSLRYSIEGVRHGSEIWAAIGRSK